MAEITSLVINFNGSNNSTNFIDETGKIITPFGSAVISTAQSKFGGSSGYFSGVSYLDVASSLNFSMSADFTVELWVYTDPSTAAWSRLIENEQHNVTGGWHFSYNGSDSAGSRRLGFQLGLNGGGGGRIDSNSAIPTNQWVHVAVTRYNNVIRMFVNGVQQTAALTTAESFSSSSLRIGATLGSASNYFTGYIDSIQIIKNRALYSESFTVPIEQPQYDPYYNSVSLLIPFDGPNNSTVFGDYSPNRNIITAYGNTKISTTQSKFGGSSGYFDGSGDYLLTQTGCFDVQTNDFTIEMWFFPTSSSATYRALFYSYDNHVAIYQYGTRVHWYYSGQHCNSASFTINTWHYVAVVRKSGVIDLYLDGVKGTSYTSALNIVDGNIYIGANSSGGEAFDGYIDELRVTKGVARYTGNFTPPAQAFYTPVNYDPFLDKLSLLLHMDGDNNSTAFKDSSVNNTLITAYGNAKISTTQSKTGGTSGYFNADTDKLALPDDESLSLDGDFTIEAWVYITGTGDFTLYGSSSSSNTNGLILFARRTSFSNTVRFYDYYTNSGVNGSSISLNIWTHLAFVRKSGTITCYINGVNDFSLACSTVFDRTVECYVGGNSSTSYGAFGYIDEFRLTNGIARYTTNFTPPTYRFYDLVDQIEYFYGVYTDFVRCAPSETIGDYRNNSRVYIDNYLYFDTVDYGEINIQGYYKIDKTPVYRKIRLCTYPNHLIIRETWSDPITGLYSFNNVKKQDYVLIFEDYENLHHSKIRRLFMDQL